MLTKMRDGTLIAFGVAGGAGISAELHDAVAKIADFFLFQERCEEALDLHGVFEPLAVHAKASANAHAVRVGNHATLVVEVTEEQIGYLSANARKFEQLFHRVGHGAAKIVDKHSAGILGVLRFDVIKPTRADVFFEFFHTRLGNRFGCGIGGKELAANKIDACIGALCRKAPHNEELPRLPSPFKGAKCLGIYLFERFDNLGEALSFLLLCHRFPPCGILSFLVEDSIAYLQGNVKVSFGTPHSYHSRHLIRQPAAATFPHWGRL